MARSKLIRAAIGESNSRKINGISGNWTAHETASLRHFGRFSLPEYEGTAIRDNGVWRVAYAFDPARKAILLVAGDKSGAAEALLPVVDQEADKRFAEHLNELENTRKRK